MIMCVYVRARVCLFIYVDYALLCVEIVCVISVVAVSGAGDCSLFYPFQEFKANLTSWEGACGRKRRDG